MLKIFQLKSETGCLPQEDPRFVPRECDKASFSLTIPTVTQRSIPNAEHPWQAALWSTAEHKEQKRKKNQNTSWLYSARNVCITGCAYTQT